MCVSDGVKDCFYVHMVVKREMILLPLLYERERNGLERGVAWTGSVAKGRSFWPGSRREKRKKAGTKDRCVKTAALEARRVSKERRRPQAQGSVLAV